MIRGEREAIAARFWKKVDKRGAAECWLWLSAKAGRGKHGAFGVSVDRKFYNIYAHRVSWFLAHGSLPPAPLNILHKCDVPLCVNPAHLFAGTQIENLDDARQKGRLVDGAHLVKVDAAGMMDILTNYVPRRNGKQLAAKYAISLVHLMRIVAGTGRVSQSRPFQRVPFRLIPIRGEIGQQPLQPASAPSQEPLGALDSPTRGQQRVRIG